MHHPHYLSQHGELPHENVEGRATGRAEALYEPRALWQVVEVPFTNNRDLVGEEVILEGTEWMNGSRYDFVLTHLLLCPINYAVLHDAYEVLQNVSVTVEHGATAIASNQYAPSAGLMQPIVPSSAFADRSQGPQLPYDYSPIPGTINPRTRRVYATQQRPFDVARWQFDQPFRLLRRGIVKFDLSSIAAAAAGYNDNGFRRVTIGFDEAWSSGGGMRQEMRVHQGRLFGVSQNTTATPFGPPPIQSGVADATPPNAVLWPHDSQFPSKSWQAQEAGRGGGDGSGWLQGFTVQLPAYHNIGNLDRLPVNANGGAGPQRATGVSLATRIGCRASTTNGGTGRQWWRPGAPLALVTPTIGASLCTKLQTPLRLGCREQLRVVLRSAAQANLLSGFDGEVEGGEQIRSGAGTFKVGVSLTGYAIVKD